MELRIKQRVFSWSDTYDVYDWDGTPRYYVRGKVFALGHQIHVFDKASGVEIGSVHQRLFSLLPTFDIVMNGRRVGSIRREFSFRPRYRVDFKGWQVEGDFLGWEYRAFSGGLEVLSVSKQWLSWGDTYTLRFVNPADEIPGLLLVIAIDAANCQKD